MDWVLGPDTQSNPFHEGEGSDGVKGKDLLFFLSPRRTDLVPTLVSYLTFLLTGGGR